MLAEDQIPDVVERPTPEAFWVPLEKALHALKHFTGGFHRKRDEEDGAGRDAVLEEVGHAVDQRARFATAWPRQNQDSAIALRDDTVLILIEGGAIVERPRRPSGDGAKGVRLRHGDANDGGPPPQRVDAVWPAGELAAGVVRGGALVYEPAAVGFLLARPCSRP